MRSTSSLVAPTKWRAPTRSLYKPAFFAKDCRWYKDQLMYGEYWLDRRSHLANKQRHTLLCEQSHSLGILVQITRSETLVRRVEEGKMLLTEEELGERLPLF
jgi:hypothetical protein